MRNALDEIENNGLSVIAAPVRHDVPTTLRRYIGKFKHVDVENIMGGLTPNYTVRKVFSLEEEKQLCDYSDGEDDAFIPQPSTSSSSPRPKRLNRTVSVEDFDSDDSLKDSDFTPTSKKPCHVRFISDETSDDSSDEDLPLAHLLPANAPPDEDIVPVWTKNTPDASKFSTATFDKPFGPKIPVNIESPSEIFFSLFDEELCNRIITESNLSKVSMQGVACFFLIMVSIFTIYSSSSASVINCPLNNFQQEINPKISQLCYAIEQALQDSPSQNDAFAGRLIDERNTNLNAKRQDVDHVFLRFGRRFGL
ncbi:unnamed protein product [Ceutorhynchus assimilis]|uniref:Uncharacterized protein n=1 Tax=Ceutorhynchus assimilis TaxID=467358 RepID=A0A9N9M9S0_9CUCU|nr:unnamed protein product [Ceutorhynchus assimilis]